MRAESEPARTGDMGDAWFEDFERARWKNLSAAFLSVHGIEIGTEVAADTAAYAWEHRDRLATMANPVGYLYRFGQSAARRHRRWNRDVRLPAVPQSYEQSVDPDIPRALAELSERQRTAVALVHVHGWTLEATAEAMGIDVSSVRTHVARGLTRMRQLLNVEEER